MRIGMVQCNPVVGDVRGNTDRLIAAIRTLDADIVVTPEMSICGYPPRDLLCCSRFVQSCQEGIERIAHACSDKTILVGHPRVNAASGRIRNSVSVLQGGEIVAVADKQLLPSYDVFDEKRYFEAGEEVCTFELYGDKIGLAICEDFWRGLDASAAPTYDDNPILQLLDSGCKTIISPSASPFVVGKHETHLQYALDLASDHEITIAMCNQVGGNDDLIFDGGSFLVTQSGVLGTLPLFKTGTIAIDSEQQPIGISTIACEDEERFNALVLGTRDYFCKTGHSKALLGISGGIDSAVVATLAVAALGKDAVTGVLMPSRYSSLGSVEDAEQLAKNLDIATVTLPIEHMHRAFERTMSDSCLEATGLTDEIVQARIRGLLLMACANHDDAWLL
ncbi:MAG: NAD(+) synthase, partial [Planctomycetes bacterium]|nr:NAD(+) synthase [Planctomycetota bacterium]